MAFISFEETLEALEEINTEVIRAWHAGDPYQYDFVGRPIHNILNYDPIRVEKFGIVRNRAPLIESVVALKGLYHASRGNVIIPHVIGRSNRGVHGYRISAAGLNTICESASINFQWSEPS